MKIEDSQIIYNYYNNLNELNKEIFNERILEYTNYLLTNLKINKDQIEYIKLLTIEYSIKEILKLSNEEILLNKYNKNLKILKINKKIEINKLINKINKNKKIAYAYFENINANNLNYYNSIFKM